MPRLKDLANQQLYKLARAATYGKIDVLFRGTKRIPHTDEERYQERYGFWRPIIGTTVRKFLKCGDLKHGFARVRCPRCREDFFVPSSCRVRCFCPSCHEKRALEKAGWVAEHVCAEVPHRQFVFTIPKRLRIYFRFDRRLMGDLCRAAAHTAITVYRSASVRPDAVPGMVGAIQTFGQLVH